VPATVVLPESPDYDQARRPAMSRFAGVRPQAVVRCTSAADVAEAVAYARARELPVAVRSGGHSFAGDSTTDGVVIDVSPISGVALSQGRAVIGAGTRLGEVYDALSARGRTIPAGCGPDVGVSGLTLGGGLGILGRMYGLTCDSLRAATVVLADGRPVECSEADEPDLFWLVRGGGVPSLPGVVTTLIFETVPAPESTAFKLTFPARQAVEAIAGWQAAGLDAPDAVAASLVLSAPADPANEPVVVVFGAVVGDAAFGREQIDGLAAHIGAPATDQRQHGAHRATKQWLSSLGPHSEPEPDDGDMYVRSEFIRRPLDATAVRTLADGFAADRIPGQARELDFNPWGGAYNRVPAAATAFPHRAERFLLKQSNTGVPSDWLDASYAVTHPYGDGGVYPNFPEPDQPDEAYYKENTARVRQIRAAYDPDRVFTVG
jgi:FAD/FMN-containing dehydrogenase